MTGMLLGGGIRKMKKQSGNSWAKETEEKSK